MARGEHGHQVRGTEWASLAATAVAGEAARPASWSSAPRGSLVATLKTGRQRVSTTVDGRIGIVNPGQHRRVKSRGNTHPKTAPIASARP